MLKRTVHPYRGAVAIVTGAASGIGRSLAKELARRGSEIILADLQVELAEEIAAVIRAAGCQAQAVKVDVAEAAEVEALIGHTVERAGRLDYLFNNAGIGIGGPIGKLTLEDWDRAINVNLRGVIHGVRSAYPIMLCQGFGHIVNTASTGGLIPTPGTVAYSAAKHGVVGLSTSLRAEVAAAGIRVSVLCPGLVRTAILAGGGKYGRVYTDLSLEQQLEISEQFRPMPADQFARQALNAVARNVAIIVIPSWWKLLWWMHRLSPDLVIFVMRRMIGANMAREAAQQR